MLVELAARCESLTVNDGHGPPLFFTRAGGPQDVPAGRVMRHLQDGNLVKAQWPGIENDTVVAVDFGEDDWKARPVGPVVRRTT